MRATLDQLRAAPSVLDVVVLSDALAAAAADAGAAGGGVTEAARRSLVEAMADRCDAPVAIAATHALARLPGDAACQPLRDALEAADWLAPHAAWAAAGLVAAPALGEPLVEPLLRLVESGRLGGMLAQRTLARWMPSLAQEIIATTTRRLAAIAEPLPRARLVETLGLAGGGEVLLRRLAADHDEPIEVRAAAIAALGDRPAGAEAVLAALAVGDDPTADWARLALVDRRAAAAAAPGGDRALRVTQVHLGGHLDRALAHAGQGSTGGIATLLVQLGDALAGDPRVAAVTTIGRGTAADALGGLAVAAASRALPGVDEAVTPGVGHVDGPGMAHAVVPAPLGRHEDAAFTGAWPAVVAAERGLRRILAHRPTSVLHLRMADVGSLAASRVARRQGIPTVFTLAPDPHALIAEMERVGELDRASFGPADAAGALWFRARLVRHLADTAREVVLFPRSELQERLRALLGIAIAEEPDRYHVVPEGIDPRPVRAARVEVAGLASSPGAPAVLADLRAAVAALGPDRQGLPLVASVGRLAEVKGMARLVEAFADDPDLRRRANLVIVGGDLVDPTPEERAEIERVEAVLARRPEVAHALVMLGHRPHDDVLRVLAAADAGLGPEVAPGGAYACGSRKEEFGLAIVEALAAGLPVVAPHAGGPPSYVEDGVTGRVADTLDRRALADAIRDALDLAGREGRAARARDLVARRFSIGAMSDALLPVYGAAERAPVGPTAAPPAVVAAVP